MNTARDMKRLKDKILEKRREIGGLVHSVRELELELETETKKEQERKKPWS